MQYWLEKVLMAYLGLAAAAAGTAPAQTVTLDAAADSYLASGSANQNQGGESILRVRSSGKNRTLVRFDQGEIAGAVGSGTLVAAHLELFIEDNGDNWGTSGRTVSVHRLGAAWTEAGVTWNCPDDADPQNGSADCPAQWSGGTFAPSETGAVLHANGLAGRVAFDVTADVAAFLAGTANSGWLVKLTNEGQNGNVSYTSRDGAAGQAPRLVLEIESTTTDATPPTLALRSPSRPVVVGDDTPEIAVDYADGGSGVDLGSLLVRVDDTDVTSGCAIAAAGAVCEPPPLAAGVHVVTAEVSDLAGNTASAELSFELLLGEGPHTVRFPAVADTYLRQGSPNQNQGAEALLRLQASGHNRALVRFDAAEIAAAVGEAAVVDATLELFVEFNAGNWGTAGRTVDAHRLLSGWSEGGATWNCADDAVPTNQQPECDPLWDGGAFEAEPTATVLQTNELTGPVTFDVTSDVAAIFAGGAVHHGWLVKKTDEGQNGHVEYSSREATAGQEPRLRLVFAFGDAVDVTPPTLSITSPLGTGVFNDSQPPIHVVYADDGTGVDLDSLEVDLDGGSLLASCDVGPATATCTPSPLAEASHVVTVRLRDQAGNGSAATREFEIVFDDEAPDLAIVEPSMPTVFTTESLFVELTFSDAGSGVDYSSLELMLNQEEPTEVCRLSGLESVRCELLGSSTGSFSGPLVLEARIADQAGNVTQASFAFEGVADMHPPDLTIVSPDELRVLLGTLSEMVVTYSDDVAGVDPDTFLLRVDGLDVSSGCAVTATSATCSAPPLTAGAHSVVAFVRDRAGNPGSRIFDFEVLAALPDTRPPEVEIVAPGPSVEGTATVEVRVVYSDADSGVDLASVAVTLDGADLLASCEVAAAATTCQTPALAAGVHAIRADVADVAGNRASTFTDFALTPQLGVTITDPSQGFLTREDRVTLTGMVSPATESVTVRGVEAQVDGGIFVASDVPLTEGNNTLTVIARTAAGGIGTASVDVIRDTAAPRTVVRSPIEGSVTASSQITVTGEVIDPSTSTGEVPPPTVTVNGIPAQVEQRSFMLTGLLLVPGENVLQVTATDAAGNARTQEVRVVYDAGASLKLEEVLGSGQAGTVGETLDQPLVVRVSNAFGQPLPGRRVTFEVTRGNGEVSAFPQAGRRLTVRSDEQGLAEVAFQLGSRSGAGLHEVTATSPGFRAPVTFCASARPTAPHRIVRIVGTNQLGAWTAAAGAEAPFPLLAQVFDIRGNPLAGVDVTYRVEEGGGSFAGEETRVVTTDSEGKAAARFRLGPEPGISNNRVSAGFEGLTEASATFVISGLEPGPEEATELHGVVLDNQDDPVPGVTVHVTNTSATAWSDADGRFVLEGVPVGNVHLEVFGASTTRPGTWPTLAYVFTTVSGQVNELGMPIRLLPLDDGLVVGGPEDVTLPIADVAGAELTVFANSATFPDGSTTGTVSITQVHADKVPMQAPLGSSFMLAWTVQPPGVRFDPPARIAIPNVGGDSPGTVVDVYSFDHDKGEFVAIGTASVSADGRQLISNVGAGVVKGGWHGCVPPPRPGGNSCNPGSCRTCGGESTEPRFSITSVIASGSAASGSSSSQLGGPATGGKKTVGVEAGQAIRFQVTAEADCQLAYSWNFGDGATSQEQNPLHSYERTGVFTARVQVKCETCPDTRGNDEAEAVNVDQIRVKEVTFSGDKYHTVLEDGTAGTPYDPPHWQDNSSPRDGDAEDMGDRRFPVAFTRNTVPRVAAKFEVKPEIPADVVLEVKVRASGPDGLKLPETDATLSGKEIEVAAIQAEGPLPDRVDRLDLELKWEVSLDGGKSWIEAGTSDTRAYLLLGDPVPITPLHESVLDIGCRNAAGATDKTQLVDKAWSEFTDLTVTRKEVDGHNRTDGAAMRYWLDREDPNGQQLVFSFCQTIEAMLSPTPGAPGLEGVGTCTAWSRLFHRILRSHGITSSVIVRVEPDVAAHQLANGLLVKDYVFAQHIRSGENGVCDSSPAAHTDDRPVSMTGAQGDLPCVMPGRNAQIDTEIKGDDQIGNGIFTNLGIPYHYTVFDEQNRAETHGRSLGDVVDQPGVPAQGVTENPESFFNQHFVVKYDGKIYDPSYGIGPSTEIEHENASLAGITARLRISGEFWLVVKMVGPEKDLVYVPTTLN